MRVDVQVREADFDLAVEWAACRARCGGRAGAVVAFGGLVRDQRDDGDGVRELRLEHYPGMTEASIERIVARAGERWRLLDVSVIHRVGRLRPRDQIVLVLVASSHRPDAFAAAEFLMDHLKTEAVFWKKESGDSGAAWLAPTARDRERQAAW